MALVTRLVRESLAFVIDPKNSAPNLRPALPSGAWLKLFCAFFLLAFGSSAYAGSAPSVQFLGVPTPVFTAGMSFPIGLAVDTNGNIYIANYSNMQVLKETLQGNGSYVQSTIDSFTSFSLGPVGLAVDTAGNVFIGFDTTCTTSCLIKETLQGDGTYVRSYLGSGLYSVWGVAVDSGGNVFATSNGDGAAVYKFIPSGSTYSSNIIYTGSSGAFAGLALDSGGDVFFTLEYQSTLYKLIPGGTPATTTTYTSSTFSLPTGVSAFGVAVDSSNDLYIADTSGKLRLESPNGSDGYDDAVLASGLSSPYGVTLSPAGTIYFGQSTQVDMFGPGAVSLGTKALKSTTDVTNLRYTVESGTVVSSIDVVSQGIANTQSGSPEFVQASGSTCIAHTYSGKTTCTVNVTFAPQFPGLRTGAAEFLDGSGNILSTVYLYGIGQAPVAGFNPGTASLLAPTGLDPTPLNGARGSIVDAAGNLYIADSLNNRIVKVAPGGAATVLSTPGITLSAPTGIAIDGAGNLYIADSSNGRVVELSEQGAASVLNANSLALSTNYGVAVDPQGNVYTTDATNNRVLVFPPFGSAYVLNTTGVTLGSAYGVAADGSGNVFIADYSNAQIVKVKNGSAMVLGTGALSPVLASPEAVTVDAVGNVYVSDSGNNRIVEILTGTTNGVVLGTGSYTFSLPNGAAVGNLGDLYITDSGNNRIVRIDQETPASINYPTPTVIGTTDAADGPQTVTVENLGNASLVFTASGVTAPIDFIQVAGSGAPSDCANRGTVAAGASCNLGISFMSTTVGSLSEFFVLTNNALNGTNATQSIGLSGTGIPAGDTTTTAVAVTPSAPTYGQPANIIATVKDTTTASSTPTGTVSITDASGTSTVTLGTPTLSGNTASLTGVPLSVGSHTITANYSGTAAGASPSFQKSTGAIPVVVSKASATVSGPATQPVFVVNSQTGSIAVTVTGQFAGTGIAAPGGSVTYAILNSSRASVASDTLALTVGSANSTATIPVPNTLAAGNYTVTVTYGGDSNYAVPATATTTSLQVGQIQPVIRWAQPAAIVYGTSLSGKLSAFALSASTVVPGTYAYTATLTGGSAVAADSASVLTAGGYTLTASFTPTDTSTYKTATGTVTLTVSQATVAVVATSNSNPVLLQNPITLTATVSSSIGTPTGSVTFLDGATPVGTGTVNSAGVATLAISTLAVGSHSITAAYSGETNFGTASSSALTQLVQDFNLTISTSNGAVGATSVTALPGGAAVFTFTLSPVGSTSFPATISLSASGLPAGATYTFSPATLAAGTGSTQVTLTTRLPQVSSANQQHFGLHSTKPAEVAANPPASKVPYLALALLLLPFAGRMRRASRKLGRMLPLLLLLIAGLAAIAGLNGCGSKSGYFGQAPAAYTITVTGTSGALTHSTSVTLTVE